MSAVRVAVAVLILGACLASARPRAQADSPLALLERYALGDFDAVVERLQSLDTAEPLLDRLRRDGPAWLDAGGAADRSRRRLAAATFALEAARVHAWREWKWLLNPPPYGGPLPTLYWKPAPLLIEWGCRLMREQEFPGSAERTWHLAAVAVAQRAEDWQFLIGSTAVVVADPIPNPLAAPTRRLPIFIRISPATVAVANPQDEITHLDHAIERFPDEPRLMLAQGLARERNFSSEAQQVYTVLQSDPQVGAEATMRLGVLQLRQGRFKEAMDALGRAERLTRDPDLTYLIHYNLGQALLRQRQGSAAIAEFRRALAARPGAQSATMILANLLFEAGQRGDAQQVVQAMLPAGGSPVDPHIEDGHGDDRFWPDLIARLRKEIRR
jgi:tetratricopeptide (TPR) repeat protein